MSHRMAQAHTSPSLAHSPYVSRALSVARWRDSDPDAARWRGDGCDFLLIAHGGAGREA